MSDRLRALLDAEGYSERAPQTALYEHLLNADRGGVIAQAGTGVGKSIAVLAAAGAHRARSGEQSVIVTPTRVLMDQYMAHDAPLAGKVFGMDVSELRGMSHYECEWTERMSRLVSGDYWGGCDGPDGGCTATNFAEGGYSCGYQEAKRAAADADILVTNTDMWLVNDRLLAPLGREIFPPAGALFVDEAHQLEQKMRDFASRSLNAQRLEKFKPAGQAGPVLARWVRQQGEGLHLKHARDFPTDALVAISRAPLGEKPGKRAREIQDAAQRIIAMMQTPSDACIMHVSQEAIKMEWTNVAASARDTLQRRPFGLVSATVPRTMGATLGVPDAPFIDVGHPFDYNRQASLSISELAGDYKSKSRENLEIRANEVFEQIKSAGGGALLLFSAYRDMEDVYDLIASKIRALGLTVLKQGDGVDNDVLGHRFKADGNAVLFGSESFGTGFDAPGSCLRLLVMWKLPFPGNDPIVNAIRDRSWPQYNDMMKVKAVQGIGRLIRRDTDTGHVHIADSRAVRIIDRSDPLTAHLADFRRVQPR